MNIKAFYVHIIDILKPSNKRIIRFSASRAFKREKFNNLMHALNYSRT